VGLRHILGQAVASRVREQLLGARTPEAKLASGGNLAGRRRVACRAGTSRGVALNEFNGMEKTQKMAAVTDRIA